MRAQVSVLEMLEVFDFFDGNLKNLGMHMNTRFAGLKATIELSTL